MESRITLKQIAIRAGVHITTVGRAIKKDPRVHPETAAKIRKIAQKLGYRQDPVLAALVAYRQKARIAKYRGTVAWLSNWRESHTWARVACFKIYHEGAKERLAEHGYNLEDFWLKEPGMTGKRASQILFSRGIRGLIVCPIAAPRGHLSLDWSKFSTVTFGYRLTRPKLHMFTSAHYQAVITCMRKLRALGYRKIGLVTYHQAEECMNRSWTAAYFSESAGLPEKHRFPVFTFDAIKTPPERRRDLFDEWLRRYRPEAVMSTSAPVAFWAKELGYKLPRDFALAHLTHQSEDENIKRVFGSSDYLGGIIEAARQIGHAAADFLVGMLQRGEYGVPEYPQKILLEGTFSEGKTI